MNNGNPHTSTKADPLQRIREELANKLNAFLVNSQSQMEWWKMLPSRKYGEELISHVKETFEKERDKLRAQQETAPRPTKNALKREINRLNQTLKLKWHIPMIQEYIRHQPSPLDSYIELFLLQNALNKALPNAPVLPSDAMKQRMEVSDREMNMLRDLSKAFSPIKSDSSYTEIYAKLECLGQMQLRL